MTKNDFGMSWRTLLNSRFLDVNLKKCKLFCEMKDNVEKIDGKKKLLFDLFFRAFQKSLVIRIMAVNPKEQLFCLSSLQQARENWSFT